MSDHAPSPTPSAADSFLDRHHFLLRRLHSLSGIMPVGVFVIFHLFTNAQLAWPDRGQTFQHEVNFIHFMPLLLFMEVAIWVSIGFHAALGLVYTFSSNSAAQTLRRYHNREYLGNVRYMLQRATGLIALVFIFLHVATLRWHWSFGVFDTFYVATQDGYPLAAATTARALQNNLVLVIYVIGVLSVIYHWCNGLWTAAITWGLTLTPRAMQRWGYVCATLAAALTLFMFGAVVGARTYSLTDADRAAIQRATEQGGGHHGEIERRPKEVTRQE